MRLRGILSVQPNWSALEHASGATRVSAASALTKSLIACDDDKVTIMGKVVLGAGCLSVFLSVTEFGPLPDYDSTT
jgi:hypothetical protein